MCPKSRRALKTDIAYLHAAEAADLVESLMRFRIAKYRYAGEAEPGPQHLGFIIDDVEPSAAITQDGDHVDLYAYASMAVLALQAQQREIVALRSELTAMRAEQNTLVGRS
jgi:hypothetical protein